MNFRINRYKGLLRSETELEGREWEREVYGALNWKDRGEINALEEREIEELLEGSEGII